MRIGLLILLIFISSKAIAGFSLKLDGEYLYSKVEYTHGTTSFSILSDAGYRGEAELAYGGKSIEFFADGSYSQESFKAPSSRTLQNPSLSLLDVGGGVRFMWASFQMFLRGSSMESVYLMDRGSSAFEVKKHPTTLVFLGFQIYARETKHRIMLELAGGYPVASQALEGFETKMSYAGRGTVRLDIGKTIKFGILSGIQAAQYKADADYMKFEFFAGIGITIGGIGNKGSSSYGGGSGAPRYPL